MVSPIHLYRSDTRQWVGQVSSEQPLTPYVEWDGQTWAVLERSHHYDLKGGKYQLKRVSLFVRPVAVDLRDRQQLGEVWAIGDPSCRFNAHSELLRCTPNPHGPCLGCKFYEQR